MESTDHNSSDDKSAPKLPTSVLQLPECLPASRLICRGPRRTPLQPIPCLSNPRTRCSGSSRPPRSQSPVTVHSLPRLCLTFHANRELLWAKTHLRASSSGRLSIPSPALLPYPTSRLSIWPVHPQPRPEWPCTISSLLQLRGLQLPSRAGLFQFSVTNGETHVQTRLWSPTAVLLKVQLLLCLSSFEFFHSVLSHSLSFNCTLLDVIPFPSLVLLTFPFPSHSPICPGARDLLLYFPFVALIPFVSVCCFYPAFFFPISLTHQLPDTSLRLLLCV